MAPPPGHEPLRIAYLGPAGTFTEEALLSQADLADAELVALSIGDALAAVSAGEVDYAFVPMENSIEGTVRETLDNLIFESDLLIQREVVLPISLNLLAPAGVTMADVTRIVSYPVALAQCRRFFHREFPQFEEVAATSTSDAARILAEEHPTNTAAVGTALAA